MHQALNNKKTAASSSLLIDIITVISLLVRGVPVSSKPLYFSDVKSFTAEK